MRAGLLTAILPAALLACGQASSTSAGPTAASATPAPPTSLPGCSAAPEPVGPDADASLGDGDRGGVWCLTTGQRLSVFLHAPDPASGIRWGTITPSDPGVLVPRPSGQLTLVRGVTAAVFTAARGGVVTLTALLPPCTGASACAPEQVWRATVVVR